MSELGPAHCRSAGASLVFAFASLGDYQLRWMLLLLHTDEQSGRLQAIVA
jgi:hypothetical protein